MRTAIQGKRFDTGDKLGYIETIIDYALEDKTMRKQLYAFLETEDTLMQSIDDDSDWTMEIRSRRGWFDIDLSELWRYRDLIILFVRRDFVAYYKQTVLGPLWFLLQPLLSTVVFTVIFSNIAHISTDGLPPFLFYMSGTVAWTYFASCMTQTSTTFITNAGIFGKVYFPRLVVTVAVVISNLIAFAIQFGLFLVSCSIIISKDLLFNQMYGFYSYQYCWCRWQHSGSVWGY